MIEHIAPDPAVPELVLPGDDGECYQFKQACLPQELVLEELLLPVAAPVLPDAATADGCGGDKTLPLVFLPSPAVGEVQAQPCKHAPHGLRLQHRQRAVGSRSRREGAGEDEGEGAAICGAGAEETEVCGGVWRLQQRDERDHFSGAGLGAGRRGHSSPEPSIIKFLLRMHGHLWVGALITLGDWYGGLRGGEESGVLGGYFATLCGRMPNPGTPMGRLGLGPTVEVVFHGRVKGRGFGGGAASGDKNTYLPHAPLLGDKNTCYRCGAPRFSEVATAVR